MNLSERVKQLKPSPTLELVAKAKALQAEGHDVISLSVGEPDWPTFGVAIQAGVNAIHDGRTKYTPASGAVELRKAIAERTSRELGVQYAMENVTVTSGAKFILSGAIQCLVNPGDKVVIPKPYWVSYPAMVDLAGGECVFVETSDESQFKLTADILDRHLDDKCKVLFLNSPSNPTSQVYSKEEWERIAEVLRKYPNLTIISDDIYNRLVLDQELAPHLLQSAKDLADRTLCVNGVSKSYSMTGWRIGWAVGPQELIKAMSNYQSQALGCASSVSQAASLAAVTEGDEDVRDAVATLKTRATFINENFASLSPLKHLPPQGAFYVWVDMRALIGKKCEDQVIEDSRSFCKILLENYHVVVVPGQEFGIDGYFRMSFALDQSRMGQALERLQSFLMQIS